MKTQKGFIPVAALITIALLVIGGTGAYKAGYIDKIRKNISLSESKIPENSSDFKSSSSELTSINEDWNLYKNNKLGFSMEVPKKVPTETGKFSKVVFSESGNTVTIKLEGYDGGWVIKTAKNINSNAELDALVKKVYGGSDCGFESLKPSNQTGVHKVEYSSGNSDSNCFVNYASVMRYSPTEHKVIYWIIGQDALFGDGVERMVNTFKFI